MQNYKSKLKIDPVLNLIKKIIPEPLFEFFQPVYHFLLAFAAAFIYGFPSRLRQGFGGQARKMTVIGVTGTKGKTTTCNLIAQVLNFSGLKTGMATTVNFRIGDKEWKNETKQTMLGRFQLQKLLSQMAEEKCKYAVIETSSEGILQYRHRFIDYDVAVFTNLTPEHIERHGSFENYRNAKIKLFKQVAKKTGGIGIYNLDDENVGYFLKPKISKQHVFTLRLSPPGGQISNLYRVSKIKTSATGTSFMFSGGGKEEKFEMPLIGEFNVYNAAAAISAARALNVPLGTIKKALPHIQPPPGRLEIVKGKNFTVIIDYAHEPASLEAVYKTIRKSIVNSQKSKVVCLLGAQGGGRDKWKRPEMGKIAAEYCDKIILTNEDPYDENPATILDDIEAGFSQIPNSKFQISKNYWKMIDRREAIKKAISLAKRGDVAILTGKGGESWMCVKNNKKIPWDEKKIVEDLL
jgi:UDP-N-acetylmuramoyl-L-alanyl-D-glutamate--2,6-diaminopimelate ligase